MGVVSVAIWSPFSLPVTIPHSVKVLLMRLTCLALLLVLPLLALHLLLCRCRRL